MSERSPDLPDEDDYAAEPDDGDDTILEDHDPAEDDGAEQE